MDAGLDGEVDGGLDLALGLGSSLAIHLQVLVQPGPVQHHLQRGQ
jgi:hypothetical protein